MIKILEEIKILACELMGKCNTDYSIFRSMTFIITCFMIKHFSYGTVLYKILFRAFIFNKNKL